VSESVKKTVVLDSFALVSLFHKEPGWERVESVLRQLSASGKRALLSRINWGEFYYIIKRRVGRRKTDEAIALLEQLPIEMLSVDDQLVREAAEIKADYPVSYADAFCIATAKRAGAHILTNDPEFEAVQHIAPIIWLTGKEVVTDSS
jgi:predicted nucleic acid-binding protein